MAFKQRSSGLPFKELGSSPAKQSTLEKPKKKRENYPLDHPILEGGKYIQREDGMIVPNKKKRSPKEIAKKVPPPKPKKETDL